MRDQHEQDTWDQDKVEIVDLGAPEQGLSRYLFMLGKQWQAAASLRGKLFLLLVTLCLLVAILLPGASGANSPAPVAPRAAPAHAVPDILYIIDCSPTSNISISLGQATTWQQLVSKPAPQACNVPEPSASPCPLPPLPQQRATAPRDQNVLPICSVGTPSPARTGNAGKNH